MFSISPVQNQLDQEIQAKIDLKTKPQGALGSLETIAFQICKIQNTLTPQLLNPTIAVFAADHGIAKSGLVNPYPQEVTAQMVFNFLSGGAAINVLAKQANMNLKVIDAGVNHDFDNVNNLIDAKIGFGTSNYLEGKAMTSEQCNEAMQKGIGVVASIHEEGSNIIGFGEMGIGNTSSASLIMSVICQLPIEECVGKGTGVNLPQLNQKIDTLKKVLDRHSQLTPQQPLKLIQTVGGFEIVQMCAGMLKAAELGMTIIVDGFISTAAFLLAHQVNKSVLDYSLFAHCSDEQGHKKMLDFLNVKPIVNLGMRLGEGTGCAIAFPVIQSACAFMNEMASFEAASVSQKM